MEKGDNDDDEADEGDKDDGEEEEEEDDDVGRTRKRQKNRVRFIFLISSHFELGLLSFRNFFLFSIGFPCSQESFFYLFH